MSFSEWTSERVFQFVHGNNLVYNTCWEDPRLDREALALGPDDTVLVITSAGCNALDYALAGAGRVITVDMNPRQNALLELKMAGIRGLQYEDFFAMFGLGRHKRARRIYEEKLRPSLSAWAQNYWDWWIAFFEPWPQRSFYFRGTCGTFAMLIGAYINLIARARPGLDALLEATSLDEQRQIYDEVQSHIWTRSLRFAMNRDTTLSFLGVPREQRRQIELEYEGGVSQFVHDCLDSVFGRLPLADNYFWRVYITGHYTPSCCPSYLQPDNFERLKAGLVDRVETHTDTIQGFLEKNDSPISRFVLLDHMDWLSDRRLPLLQSEWQWIVRRAAADTRLIWRSGGLHTDFVDRLPVTVNGRERRVGEILTYRRPLAQSLHKKCRVHTYGSFHIAELTP